MKAYKVKIYKIKINRKFLWFKLSDKYIYSFPLETYFIVTDSSRKARSIAIKKFKEMYKMDNSKNVEYPVSEIEIFPTIENLRKEFPIKDTIEYCKSNKINSNFILL